MRTLFLILFFVSALFASNPFENIYSYKLKNGLQVYLYPDKKSKNSAINIEVKVGMKAENEDNAGISHLVEHIVFRDARVKDRDYLDLFIKEGATHVNGYTRYYTTNYVAIIQPQKSYWIVDKFAQMLLDKNVTSLDLEIERGALQVEIGEFTWADRFLPFLKNSIDFFKELFPPKYDFYKDEFDIDLKDKKIKYFPISIYRANNKKFTFEKVLKHYRDYYYPSNMTLNVVGNFDIAKMKQVIEKSFGKYKKRDGKSVEKEICKTAKLNNKPYTKYIVGRGSNRLIIGTKFIADDPKKVIILRSYVDDLSKRLNRVFRNKNGESYGAFGKYDRNQNAALVTLFFSFKHNSFDKNIKYTQAQISKETSGELNDEIIEGALDNFEKRYSSLEHDSKSLMNFLLNYQDFKDYFKVDKDPYEILKSIKPYEYKKVVQETFKKENSYTVIKRDYYIFPHELSIFILFLTLLSIYFILKTFRAKIENRLLFERRLTGRFISFVVIFSSFFVSLVISSWICFFLSRVLPINYLWINGYDVPISYFIRLVDFFIFIFVLYFVSKYLYKWFYIKIFVTDKNLILSGSNAKYIDKSDIKSIDTVKWKPSYFSKTYGLSPFILRPLVKIDLKNSTIYLRAKNAEHLKSDLEFVLMGKKSE